MDALLQRVLATPPVLAFFDEQSTPPAIREGVKVFDSALRHLQSYADIKLEVFKNKDLARALLVTDNLDAILTHRLSLDSSQGRVVCAIAFNVACQSDEPVAVGQEFLKVMQAATIDHALGSRVEQVLSDEAHKMTDQIAYLEAPGPSDYAWMLVTDDPGSDKPRNLIFIEGQTTQEEMNRAFVAVFYGLDSDEITSVVKKIKTPDLSRKLQAARLRLAAGMFPEPALYGEYASKRSPAWLRRLWRRNK